ncbi:MAG: AEC family transporter [Alphaproteobacteria bacterium]|nr:AEC family transporter [Alphaproteobacteria bacterium]
MLSILVALLPVFLLILLGTILAKAGFPGQGFWPLVDRFSYFVLFPALLVKELASADLGRFDPLPMVAGMSLGLYAQVALLMTLRARLPLDGPTFTSFFQGSLRFNTFTGLAAAQALHGGPGVALFAVAVAAMVPQINVFCVGVLARYAYGKGAGWRNQARLIATNPMILACLVGIALNLSEIRLPPVAGPVIDALGRAALAFGLMAVGAALDLRAARQGSAVIAGICTLKLLVFPLLMWCAATLLGIEGLTRAIMVLWAAMPISPASYILARQLGGNAQLMAAAISATTLAAAFSVAPVLAILG